MNPRIEYRDVANFYDLLSKMVERTPWATEKEKDTYVQLIEKLRALNVFGYMVSTTEVDNPEKDRPAYRGGY